MTSAATFALVRRLVREHRLAADVADREDVRHVSALLAVDRDVAALVHDDPRLVGRDLAAVRPPSDREQHALIQLRRRRLLALESREQPVLPRLELRDLGLEVNRLVALPDPRFERLDEVAVGAGDKPVEELDDGDLGAERVVHARHLEADDAPADHEHPLRNGRQFERAGRVDEARVVVGEARDPRDRRPGGDDAIVERDALRPVGGLHEQRLRRLELPHALDDRDLPLLGEAREALRQPAHDRRFPRAELVHVELRLAEVDAEVAHLLRLGDDPGGVEERLRRDAANVQADPAQRRVALDEHCLLPEVGSTERGGVAARSRTEHDDFARDVGRPAGNAAPVGGRGRRPGDCRRGRGRPRLCRTRPARAIAALRVDLRRRRIGLGRIEQQDRGALRDLVADLHDQPVHDAGGGRRDFHRRLVRLERDERALLLDAIAGLDEDLDDVDGVEVADVGNLHLDGRAHWATLSLRVKDSRLGRPGALMRLLTASPDGSRRAAGQDTR